MNKESEPSWFIVNIQGWEYQISQRCPHRSGQLRYGYINEERRTITCPLHQSCFSLESGEQLFGPPCHSIQVSKRKNPDH